MKVNGQCQKVEGMTATGDVKLTVYVPRELAKGKNMFDFMNESVSIRILGESEGEIVDPLEHLAEYATRLHSATSSLVDMVRDITAGNVEFSVEEDSSEEVPF